MNNNGTDQGDDMSKDTKNNTGIENSGNRNSGGRNSGDWNSGNRNSGNWNSGYGNSGYWNSGNWNSGYRNSGYRNSGNWNSGDRNSGDRNSGYGNSTGRSSGIFNSEEGTVRLFNKESSLKWDDIDHPSFDEFILNRWVAEDDMTDEEKKADPQFFVRQGYLKTYTNEEAWANYWKNTTEKERQKVLNLPNFDATVFKECTGIDVHVARQETITIGGIEYDKDEVEKRLKDIKPLKG